jgi:hypothetical protein
MVTSVPVTAARMSVFRTFLNDCSFRGARAKASPQLWAGAFD